MHCKKCGKEVQNEWSFCNYCGEKIDKHNEKKKSIKNIICVACGIIGIIFIVAIAMYIINSNSKIVISDNKISKIEFNATINQDTTMNVEEIWTVEGIDIDTLYKSFIDDEEISNVEVYEILENGSEIKFNQSLEWSELVDENTYSAFKSEENSLISWGAKINNKSKKFKILYTIDNFIKVYQDYSILEWRFIDNINFPIDKVDGKIQLDISLNKEDGIIEYFLFTDNKSQDFINLDNNIIDFSITNVDLNQFSYIYILTPSQCFNQTNKDNNIVRFAIECELFNWASYFSNGNITKGLENYYVRRKEMYMSQQSEEMANKINQKIIQEYDELLGVKDSNAQCEYSGETVYKDPQGRYVPSQLFGGQNCNRHLNKHYSLLSSELNEIKNKKFIKSVYDGSLIDKYDEFIDTWITNDLLKTKNQKDDLKLKDIKMYFDNNKYIFICEIENESSTNTYSNIGMSARTFCSLDGESGTKPIDEIYLTNLNSVGPNEVMTITLEKERSNYAYPLAGYTITGIYYGSMN